MKWKFAHTLRAAEHRGHAGSAPTHACWAGGPSGHPWGVLPPLLSGPALEVGVPASPVGQPQASGVHCRPRLCQLLKRRLCCERGGVMAQPCTQVGDSQLAGITDANANHSVAYVADHKSAESVSCEVSGKSQHACKSRALGRVAHSKQSAIVAYIAAIGSAAAWSMRRAPCLMSSWARIATWARRNDRSPSASRNPCRCRHCIEYEGGSAPCR